MVATQIFLFSPQYCGNDPIRLIHIFSIGLKPTTLPTNMNHFNPFLWDPLKGVPLFLRHIAMGSKEKNHGSPFRISFAPSPTIPWFVRVSLSHVQLPQGKPWKEFELAKNSNTGTTKLVSSINHSLFGISTQETRTYQVDDHTRSATPVLSSNGNYGYPWEGMQVSSSFLSGCYIALYNDLI